MMFIHLKIKKLISAYIDSEVTREEKNLVETHLAACSRCRKYYQKLQKVSATIQEWENEDVSSDLELKIRQKLLSQNVKGGTMKKTKLFVGLTSGALATLLVFILAGQVYMHRTQPQSQPRTASEKAEQQNTQRGPVTQQPPPAQSLELGKDAMTIIREEAQVNFLNSFGFVGKLQSVGDNIGDQYSPGAYRLEEEVMPFKSYGAGTLAEEGEEFNTEGYNRVRENDFLEVKENPLSTLSTDVDTASYSNVRRFINEGRLPPPDAVRIEEMINYFDYNYPGPVDGTPFSITTEISYCPWNASHRLVLVGLQGERIETQKLPPSNLVFLVDVSGSMDEARKLPLVQSALKLLVKQLRPQDRVAIVVYAGAAGLVLDSTPGDHKETILAALEQLRAGGSTAGGAGIKLAYAIAERNFIKTGNNRVILATDGDFNVGASSDAEMERLIEKEKEKGIFLTVAGFGTGNYKDSKMEILADKGNGNYAYIDNILEARKVFVKQIGATILTIAKDVKIQIEFNPQKVKAYRLIGYENRILSKEDFNNDKKDAGELGAGHSVTALYEIVPADSTEEFATIDPLRYQDVTVKPSTDIMTIKFRYKEPNATESKLLVKELKETGATEKEASENLQFASAVAEFGLILRNSPHKGTASYEGLLRRARLATGNDHDGYRAEFIRIVDTARIFDEEAKN
ncbi:MAG: von Willebrand factor type A domain-containing protein [Candidatus Omnitrophica bacterium]|nr:von Willebrand factor type A domain-containing protein [Candidatus Omnitrophota bacterium]